MADFERIDDDYGFRFKFYISWLNLIEKNKKDLERILTVIFNRCFENNVRISPKPEYIFNSFEVCSFNELKVVILGQDPYATSDANGIAFSVYSGRETPSLTVIKNWLYSCYPGNENKNFDTTLISWCRQGVLLINTSLTIEVINNKPRINHKKLWEIFVRSCLQYCSSKEDVVFVLMGDIAADYEDSINENSFVIKTEHPASQARRNIIKPNDFFITVNNRLSEEIDWCSVFT